MYDLGDVVAGKYRIDCQLGEGGMGSVFGATHLALGTQVALKFLRSDIARKPAVVQRFLHEARASAQLRSDSVCRVFDVGTLETGVPYIVMEWLVGSDLTSYLRATGPIAPELICEYILQACHALAEAHVVGIVHRDLKPANLFLTQRLDGAVLLKVLDFGVAKAPDVADLDPNQSASVMGSPGYMSPEQLQSSDGVDARSDIWSLGVVMYELLSGRKPFTGASLSDLAQRIARDPMPALPASVPAPLAAIVACCLGKRPSDRFSNVAELAAALAPLLGSYGYDLAASVERVLRGATMSAIAVPRVRSGPGTMPSTMRGAAGMFTADASRLRQRMPLIVALGAAAGAIGIVLITAIGRGHSGHASSAAQPAKIELRVESPAATPPSIPAALPPPQPTIVQPAAVVAKPPPSPPPATTRVMKPSQPPPSPPSPPSSGKVRSPEDVGDSRY